jgi:hypothetical protein
VVNSLAGFAVGQQRFAASLCMVIAFSINWALAIAIEWIDGVVPLKSRSLGGRLIMSAIARLADPGRK